MSLFLCHQRTMVSLVSQDVILSSLLKRCLRNYPGGILLSLPLIHHHSKTMLWGCDKSLLLLTLPHSDCGSSWWILSEADPPAVLAWERLCTPTHFLRSLTRILQREEPPRLHFFTTQNATYIHTSHRESFYSVTCNQAV